MNLRLALGPFAPSLSLATTLLLCAARFSQMDVHTRISYVMAGGSRWRSGRWPPASRKCRAAWPLAGRTLAGAMLAVAGFWWPLVLAGGLEIAYHYSSW